MEDSIRQGVTIVTGVGIYGTSNNSSSNNPPYEQVDFTVSFMQVHLCDAMVYELDRQGDTVTLAFFLTQESTAQGFYARWGYDGPYTASRIPPGRSVDEMTCENVYVGDSGKTMNFTFPMGSFEGGAIVTVITNLGQVGASYTFSWGPM